MSGGAGVRTLFPSSSEATASREKPDVVESVVKCQRNGPLIAVAADLWIEPDDVVVDATYGKGNFWTVYRPANLIAHDKYVGDGVDFQHLPELDASVDVVVLDPPYIPQGGRETSTTQDFLDRYGLHEVPKTANELNLLIASGMSEASRVLKPGGRLFVKCMDYINGGRYVQGRHAVVMAAILLGLEQVDELVHHSGAGPHPKHRATCGIYAPGSDGPVVCTCGGRKQLHSRRVHSFLCIFQKPPIRRKNASKKRQKEGPE